MTPQPVPRATRYPVNLPLRYRAEGEAQWSYGMTVNMSHTGILFRADRELDAERRVEIEVVLPGDAEGGASVVSRGAIARRMSADGTEPERGLAVTIGDYRFVRTPRHVAG